MVWRSSNNNSSNSIISSNLNRFYLSFISIIIVVFYVSKFYSYVCWWCRLRGGDGGGTAVPPAAGLFVTGAAGALTIGAGETLFATILPLRPVASSSSSSSSTSTSSSCSSCCRCRFACGCRLVPNYIKSVLPTSFGRLINWLSINRRYTDPFGISHFRHENGQTARRKTKNNISIRASEQEEELQ